MRARLRVLLFVVLAALGCGRGGAQSPSHVPLNVSNEAIAAILGSPSHVTVAVNMQAILRDPTLGPAARMALANPKPDSNVAPEQMTALVLPVTRIEGYFATHEISMAAAKDADIFGELKHRVAFVFVIRGIAIDARQLKTPRGTPSFAAVASLPSGVMEYVESPTTAAPEPAHVFVMVDGVWVVVDSASAARARAYFGSARTAPAPIELDGSTVGSAFLDRAALEHLGSLSVAGSAPEHWTRLWRQLTSVGMIARTVPRRSLEIVLELQGEAAATQTKDSLNALLKKTRGEDYESCGSFVDWCRRLQLTQSSRRVTLTVDY